MPISNFFGWILTTYVFYQLFALYVRNRVSIPSPTSHWRLAILFYAASAAGNLLVAAPVSLSGVFVDSAGKRWMYKCSRTAALCTKMGLNHCATRELADVIRTVKRWLSRRCHGSRGKTLKNPEQTVNTEEKLALAFHRNLLISFD